jgi:hypothetical protein
MMAAGFAESYIRLWSLKGEKLRGMRSDFQPSSVKDRSCHSVQQLAASLTIHFSGIIEKAQGKRRNGNQKADRAQWTSLLALL